MPDLPPGPHLPAAWPAPVRRRPAGFFSQSALFAHEPAPVADKCSPRRQIRALLAGEPALFCRIRAPLAHGPAPLGRKRAPLDDRPAPFCQIRAIIADRPALLGQRPAPVRRLFQAKWMNLRRCCHKLGRNLLVALKKCEASWSAPALWRFGTRQWTLGARVVPTRSAWQVVGVWNCRAARVCGRAAAWDKPRSGQSERAVAAGVSRLIIFRADFRWSGTHVRCHGIPNGKFYPQISRMTQRGEKSVQSA